MEVLLRQDVSKLGTVGDIVNVKPGYGRNYLLPKGIAVAVTKGNLKQLQHEKRKLVALEARRKEKFKEVAGKLSAVSVSIPVEASDAGHLYGSVNATMIAQALTAEGHQVEARQVLLDAPIKELGVYTVRVRLHSEVEAESKVWVVEKSS